MKRYRSQSAQDAQRIGYGDERYWNYLDETAQRYRALYIKRGNREQARYMVTRSLSECLRGNDGD